MNHSRRPIRGFTLIELLVSLTVIAVLVTLLLPSLENGRQLAQSAVCLNNVKQQITAQVNYTVASKGLLLWYHANWDQYYQEGWLIEYNLIPRGVLRSSVRYSPVLRCPVAINSVSWSTTGWTRSRTQFGNGWIGPYYTNAEACVRRQRLGDATTYMEASKMVWTNYNYNGRHPSWGSGFPLANWSEGKQKKLERAKNPSNTWYSGDGNLPDFGLSDATFRHLSRANFSYFDGHAQSLAPADVSATASSSGYAQLNDSRLKF